MRSLIVALALTLAAPPALAQATPETWTVVIDGAFSDNVYVWRIKRDGTYEEDGRDAESGEPIQLTLTGKWKLTGSHLRLEQDSDSFVFDGMRSGERYSGRFLLGREQLGTFCAWKGTRVPTGCESELIG